MASATTEQRAVSHAVVDGVEDEREQAQAQQHADDNLVGNGDCDRGRAAEVASRQVSRLAVEGAGGNAADAKQVGGGVVGNGHRLPPPHAWLAIEDTRSKDKQRQEQEHVHGDGDPGAEQQQWARLFRGGAGAAAQEQQRRRSSFSVVRRERAAREAWLDRAWEMKRSWHARNGGAPDADTPVVVVVGTSPRASQEGQGQAVEAFGGGGGVAMDVEEVRACRDLGLELPSDCTVEIQCYGLSDGGSPTRSSGAADSPCAVSTAPTAAAGGGADPTDVKARLKVWARAVALASTAHLTS